LSRLRVEMIDKTRVPILIRIRSGLKEQLTELAKREHRSLNQQIEFLLERSLSGEAGSDLNERHGPQLSHKRKP